MVLSIIRIKEFQKVPTTGTYLMYIFLGGHHQGLSVEASTIRASRKIKDILLYSFCNVCTII